MIKKNKGHDNKNEVCARDVCQMKFSRNARRSGNFSRKKHFFYCFEEVLRGNLMCCGCQFRKKITVDKYRLFSGGDKLEF